MFALFAVLFTRAMSCPKITSAPSAALALTSSKRKRKKKDTAEVYQNLRGFLFRGRACP